jgi:hypothetical protein
MSELKMLTFAAVPVAENNPLLVRRNRLIERLEEQKLVLKDPTYLRVVRKTEKLDGARTTTEKKVKVRPWWRVDEKGQTLLLARVGLKAIEFEKGKAAISVGGKDKLAGVIDILIRAARAGELDRYLAPTRTAN